MFRLGAMRPSPALVIACLSLLISLGGVGYAAVNLPKNSVGPRQIRNGAVSNKKLARAAVTSTKVARDSLTGVQVKESTLGRVPDATHAASADNAASAGNAATLAGLTPTALAGAQRRVIFAGGAATTIAPYTCVFVFSYGVGAPSDAGKVVGMWITDSGGINPPADLNNLTAFIPGTVALTSQGGTIAFAQVCNLKSTPDSLPTGWQVHTAVH
jgi:hypothetical protein